MTLSIQDHSGKTFPVRFLTRAKDDDINADVNRPFSGSGRVGTDRFCWRPVSLGLRTTEQIDYVFCAKLRRLVVDIYTA